MSYNRRQHDKKKHLANTNKSRHELRQHRRTLDSPDNGYDISGQFKGGRASIRVNEIVSDD